MSLLVCGIYKITSPSGKIYIGQASNIERRWYLYSILKCKSQSKLYNSFLKHGVDNHNFEVIIECKKEELDNLEIYYINKFDTFNTEHGLNLKSGGHYGGCHSEESKNKIRQKAIGRPSKKKGLPISEETKEKLRKINLGKKKSEESKEKQRKIAKERGFKPPIMYRDKYSEDGLKKLNKRWNGIDNPNYGNKNMTPEHKEKLRQSNLCREASALQIKHITELGKRPKSEYTKEKMRASSLGIKKNPESVMKGIETRKRIKQERLTMIF